MTLMLKVAIVGLLIVCAVTTTEAKPRRKWCHANELFFGCASPLRVFTSKVNGTGIAITDRAFTVFCGYAWKKMMKCQHKWFDKCGNDFWRDLIIGLFESAENRIQGMCVGPKREKFLKYSPCLHWKVKLLKSYRENCVRNIQAGFEYIHEKFYNASYYSKMRGMCCIYNRWENCITSHLLDECGPVSDEIIVDLIRAGSWDIFPQVCPMDQYHPSSRICSDVWQPHDMMPLGFRSNTTFMSWQFSYWCPNVGYGIDLSRDTLPSD